MVADKERSTEYRYWQTLVEKFVTAQLHDPNTRPDTDFAIEIVVRRAKLIADKTMEVMEARWAEMFQSANAEEPQPTKED